MAKLARFNDGFLSYPVTGNSCNLVFSKKVEGFEGSKIFYMKKRLTLFEWTELQRWQLQSMTMATWESH